ncbi:LLM class flavin-dependent oxidoreductase [Babesia caballi]|uniref:LLM class flavin-dependent oxidoreductase n=1 Tax=Babesia caballi TaxID=5871 RepID=A0AAV4LVD5_BABCB|nr:LLM class flavin-dependent oxidoreductase [Babesia caballi]
MLGRPCWPATSSLRRAGCSGRSSSEDALHDRGAHGAGVDDAEGQPDHEPAGGADDGAAPADVNHRGADEHEPRGQEKEAAAAGGAERAADDVQNVVLLRTGNGRFLDEGEQVDRRRGGGALGTATRRCRVSAAGLTHEPARRPGPAAGSHEGGPVERVHEEEDGHEPADDGPEQGEDVDVGPVLVAVAADERSAAVLVAELLVRVEVLPHEAASEAAVAVEAGGLVEEHGAHLVAAAEQLQLVEPAGGVDGLQHGAGLHAVGAGAAALLRGVPVGGVLGLRGHVHAGLGDLVADALVVGALRQLEAGHLLLRLHVLDAAVRELQGALGVYAPVPSLLGNHVLAVRQVDARGRARAPRLPAVGVADELALLAVDHAGAHLLGAAEHAQLAEVHRLHALHDVVVPGDAGGHALPEEALAGVAGVQHEHVRQGGPQPVPDALAECLEGLRGRLAFAEPPQQEAAPPALRVVVVVDRLREAAVDPNDVIAERRYLEAAGGAEVGHLVLLEAAVGDVGDDVGGQLDAHVVRERDERLVGGGADLLLELRARVNGREVRRVGEDVHLLGGARLALLAEAGAVLGPRPGVPVVEGVLQHARAEGLGALQRLLGRALGELLGAGAPAVEAVDVHAQVLHGLVPGGHGAGGVAGGPVVGVVAVRAVQVLLALGRGGRAGGPPGDARRPQADYGGDLVRRPGAEAEVELLVDDVRPFLGALAGADVKVLLLEARLVVHALARVAEVGARRDVLALAGLDEHAGGGGFAQLVGVDGTATALHRGPLAPRALDAVPRHQHLLHGLGRFHSRWGRRRLLCRIRGVASVGRPVRGVLVDVSVGGLRRLRLLLRLLLHVVEVGLEHRLQQRSVQDALLPLLLEALGHVGVLEAAAEPGRTHALVVAGFAEGERAALLREFANPTQHRAGPILDDEAPDAGELSRVSPALGAFEEDLLAELEEPLRCVHGMSVRVVHTERDDVALQHGGRVHGAGVHHGEHVLRVRPRVGHVQPDGRPVVLRRHRREGAQPQAVQVGLRRILDGQIAQLDVDGVVARVLGNQEFGLVGGVPLPDHRDGDDGPLLVVAAHQIGNRLLGLQEQHPRLAGVEREYRLAARVAADDAHGDLLLQVLGVAALAHRQPLDAVFAAVLHGVAPGLALQRANCNSELRAGHSVDGRVVQAPCGGRHGRENHGVFYFGLELDGGHLATLQHELPHLVLCDALNGCAATHSAPDSCAR